MTEMEIINGKVIAQEIIEKLKLEIDEMPADEKPTVAFVRVGKDPASVSYVMRKQKVAQTIGIKSILKEFSNCVNEGELCEEIDSLNANPHIHGILIQLPLPGHLSSIKLFNRILPHKDVDGFHSFNFGKLCQGDETGFVACTPAGIIELLKKSSVQTQGKHVVILGRSLIVGKPLALLLTKNSHFGNATVTVCHSYTKNLHEIVSSADIVVAAIGKPSFVTARMIKSGAVVIDVGINRVNDPSAKEGYRLVGDVDFKNVAPLTTKITPVPGGVGPMTIAMLMLNTVKAYRLQKLL